MDTGDDRSASGMNAVERIAAMLLECGEINDIEEIFKVYDGIIDSVAAALLHGSGDAGHERRLMRRHRTPRGILFPSGAPEGRDSRHLEKAPPARSSSEDFGLAAVSPSLH